MTPATPARVPAPQPRPLGGRSPALALLPAGAVAGFGLGLAALALVAPAPAVTPLPTVSAVQAIPATAAAAAQNRPAWAPLFGEAQPAPVEDQSEPEPEPEDFVEDDDPFDEFDASAFVLRGLVVGLDASDALALIETDEGMRLVRAGEILPGGYPVLAILAEGVEVDTGADTFLLEFDSDSERRNPQRRAPDRPSRSDVPPDFPDEDDDFDMSYDDYDYEDDDDYSEDDEPSFPAAARFGVTR